MTYTQKIIYFIKKEQVKKCLFPITTCVQGDDYVYVLVDTVYGTIFHMFHTHKILYVPYCHIIFIYLLNMYCVQYMPPTYILQ